MGMAFLPFAFFTLLWGGVGIGLPIFLPKVENNKYVIEMKKEEAKAANKWIDYGMVAAAGLACFVPKGLIAAGVSILVLLVIKVVINDEILLSDGDDDFLSWEELEPVTSTPRRRTSTVPKTFETRKPQCLGVHEIPLECDETPVLPERDVFFECDARNGTVHVRCGGPLPTYIHPEKKCPCTMKVVFRPAAVHTTKPPQGCVRNDELAQFCRKLDRRQFILCKIAETGMPGPTKTGRTCDFFLKNPTFLSPRPYYQCCTAQLPGPNKPEGRLPETALRPLLLASCGVSLIVFVFALALVIAWCVSYMKRKLSHLQLEYKLWIIVLCLHVCMVGIRTFVYCARTVTSPDHKKLLIVDIIVGVLFLWAIIDIKLVIRKWEKTVGEFKLDKMSEWMLEKCCRRSQLSDEEPKQNNIPTEP